MKQLYTFQQSTTSTKPHQLYSLFITQYPGSFTSMHSFSTLAFMDYIHVNPLKSTVVEL